MKNYYKQRTIIAFVAMLIISLIGKELNGMIRIEGWTDLIMVLAMALVTVGMDFSCYYLHMWINEVPKYRKWAIAPLVVGGLFTFTYIAIVITYLKDPTVPMVH